MGDTALKFLCPGLFITSPDHLEVVVLPRTANKCTKIYNARAQPLFCSLNLLFSDVAVAVAVAVVVILNFLMADRFPELPSSD